MVHYLAGNNSLLTIMDYAAVQKLFNIKVTHVGLFQEPNNAVIISCERLIVIRDENFREFSTVVFHLVIFKAQSFAQFSKTHHSSQLIIA
jgi:hypothetical protein